jgi:hypothetical protein
MYKVQIHDHRGLQQCTCHGRRDRTKDLVLSVADVERLGKEALDRLDKINGRITSINDTSLKTLGTVQDIGKDLSLLNLYQDGKS